MCSRKQVNCTVGGLSLNPASISCALQGVLETELVHALASPHRVGASPGAQVRRLQAELEAAQEEIRALQAKV